MPNGGPDCCGYCSYNRAVQEMGHPHLEQRERFVQLSYCTLRDVKITNPLWTYCRNFGDGEHPADRHTGETPRGWISAHGLYEGYVRIPWDQKNEPHMDVPATCSICGRTTARGITIDHGGSTLAFCTNRHYVRWWKTIHEDDSLVPEFFEAPEDRYEEK